MNVSRSDWDVNIRELVAAIAERLGLSHLVKVREVSGGSGARTFIVQQIGDLGAGNSGILKVGKEALIQEDVAGLLRASVYYAHASYLVADVSAGGLRAILLNLAGGPTGETFEEFYHAATAAGIEATLSQLFSSVLRIDSHNQLNGRNPFACYVFHSPEQQARALRDLGESPFTLLRWWSRAEGLAHDFAAHTSLCHGDLHRNNIIVVDGTPYVIDFGLTNVWHSMRDFAKLERDICLFLSPSDALSVTQLSDESDSGNGATSKANAAIRTIRDAAQRVSRSAWPSEYYVALLAQYIYSASNASLSVEVRRLALGYAHRFRQELERLHPALCVSEAELRTVMRKDALWRFSYAFLRLDQLASGGWARSLPGWLEALFEGDQGLMPRNPETKTKGGTDLTCKAFITYIRFLRKLGCFHPTADEPTAKTAIALLVRQNISDKIGWDGGVGTGTGRTHVHIRHSIMGLLTLLYFSECTGLLAIDEIRKIDQYLRKHLVRWKIDTTHPFACFCVLAKLREQLSHISFRDDWDPKALLKAIARAFPEMSRALLNNTKFELKPEGTCELPWTSFTFQPYSGIWRMERSNLLMYLPFLLSEDGTHFHEFLDPHLVDKCLLALAAIVVDLASAEGRISVYYHQDSPMQGNKRESDLGLTAELLAVLSQPGIAAPLQSKLKWDKKKYGGVLRGLESTIEDGFDRLHTQPLFRFTHSVSLAQYLEVVGGAISIASVKALDKQIDQALKRNTTELDLNALCERLASESTGNKADHDILVAGMRDLLVSKLCAGEHLTNDSEWANRVHEARRSTIRFFDGPGGVKYAQRYGEDAIEDFVTGICKYAAVDGNSRRVLDVGCGPGQYARLFEERGFSVELVDAANQMLRIAQGRLSALAQLEPRSIEDLDSVFPAGEFDIVFASAMLVHIPRAMTPSVFRSFYRLLRPGGGLFVNFKIGDHSLIGIGERYFEYYRDHGVPWKMLEEAGFVVREISTRFNNNTMYWDPRRILWANFYCVKPAST